MSSPPPKNSTCSIAERRRRPSGTTVLTLLVVAVLAGPQGVRSECTDYEKPRRVGRVPPALPELSGFAASRRHAGILWAHNDSGNAARIFAIREDGTVQATLRLAGIDTVDPEDIAVGPCRAPASATSCIHLAEIGDNRSRRTRVRILELDEPATLRDATVTPRSFPFVYSDGPHNAETLLIAPGTGTSYVVTKLLGTLGGVYRLDDMGPGRVGRAVYLRTLEAPAGFGDLTTGGDVHPTRARVLLRTYNRVWEYRGAAGSSIEAILGGTPVEVPGVRQPQSEAITYVGDGRAYLIGTETAGAALYRIDCRNEP